MPRGSTGRNIPFGMMSGSRARAREPLKNKLDYSSEGLNMTDTWHKDKNWFYKHEKENVGPFTSEDIVDLIKNKTLSRETPLWKVGMSAWVKASASSFSEYFGPDEYTIPPINKYTPPPTLQILLDTSSFYSASKAGIGLVSSMRPNQKIEDNSLSASFWHIIESVILYDEIFIDQKSLQASAQANEFVGELPIDCIKKVEANGEQTKSALCKTFDSFKDVLSQNKPLELLDDYMLNLVLGHHEADFSHIDGYRYNRPRHALDQIIDELIKIKPQAKDPSFNDYLKERYDNIHIVSKSWYCRDQGLSLAYWPLAKVYLNLFRCIYYYRLAEAMAVNYCPHPLRGNIWKEKQYLPFIAHDIVTHFNNVVRIPHFTKLEGIVPSMRFEYNTPPIVRYILSKSNSIGEIFKNANELRMSRKAIEFRKFCKKLQDAYLLQDHSTVTNSLNAIQSTASEWAKSLAVSNEYKKVTLRDPFGIVGVEMNIPVPSIFSTKKRGPLVFIHDLMQVY